VKSVILTLFTSLQADSTFSKKKLDKSIKVKYNKVKYNCILERAQNVYRQAAGTRGLEQAVQLGQI